MPLSPNRDHAKPADIDPRRVSERDRDDVRVLAVGAGDDRQHERQVLDPTGDRPQLGERLEQAAGPGQCPVLGTRPLVGLIPATPHRCAGWRIELPLSLPMSNGEPPAATIEADPPLLPPGERSRSYGFEVRP